MRVRITTTDPLGQTTRPWVDLDPSLTNEQARAEALRLAEAARLPGWIAPRSRLLSAFPSIDDALAYADKTDPRVVYFVRCAIEKGPTKIGFTDNIAIRFCHLQHACPFALELIGTIPGGPALEQYFHRLFAKYRTRGEWFKLPPLAERAVRQLTNEALSEAS